MFGFLYSWKKDRVLTKPAGLERMLDLSKYFSERAKAIALSSMREKTRNSCRWSGDGGAGVTVERSRTPCAGAGLLPVGTYLL